MADITNSGQKLRFFPLPKGDHSALAKGKGDGFSSCPAVFSLLIFNRNAQNKKSLHPKKRCRDDKISRFHSACGKKAAACVSDNGD